MLHLNSRSYMCKRVLLLYTDKYYLVKQVYPFGLDLIAGHLRQYGYHVTIDYPFLTESKIETNLVKILERCKPDLIGLGIRNLDTAMSCEELGNYAGPGYRTFYFLPEIKQVVESIKKLRPKIPMIAGGGAFSISPAAILKRLGIKYGIVGEGEEPFCQFLKAYPDEEKIIKIPGIVLQHGNDFLTNPRQPYTLKENTYVHAREKKFNYAYETVGLPIQVKRGCNKNCSYCVEPIIEGKKFVFKNQDDVIKELTTIAESHDGIHKIFFTDTEFNIPSLEYCTVLVKKIIDSGLHENFRFSSQFLPWPFDAGFAELLARAGFSVILTCDSFSDSILEKNRSSFRRKDIINSLELCEQFKLDCTANFIFGLPGEIFKTIDHTLSEMLNFSPNDNRRYEYTIGARIYHGTPLCHFVEKQGTNQHVYGEKSKGYLEPCFYCSPENPLKLKSYIDSVLPFFLDFQNNYDDSTRRILAISYLIDQCRWDKALKRFFTSDLAARSFIYDYFFRKLTDSGKTKMAKEISEHLLTAILQSRKIHEYEDQISIIRYYLSILTP